MSRYRNEVEQARRDLRAMGFDAKSARQRAPRLAEMRQQARDQQARPFPWLGCGSPEVER